MDSMGEQWVYCFCVCDVSRAGCGLKNRGGWRVGGSSHLGLLMLPRLLMRTMGLLFGWRNQYGGGRVVGGGRVGCIFFAPL